MPSHLAGQDPRHAEATCPHCTAAHPPSACEIAQRPPNQCPPISRDAPCHDPDAFPSVDFKVTLAATTTSTFFGRRSLASPTASAGDRRTPERGVLPHRRLLLRRTHRRSSLPQLGPGHGRRLHGNQRDGSVDRARCVASQREAGGRKAHVRARARQGAVGSVQRYPGGIRGVLCVRGRVPKDPTAAADRRRQGAVHRRVGLGGQRLRAHRTAARMRRTSTCAGRSCSSSTMPWDRWA